MEELEIRLGQRALPSVHGDQTTATAYAGLGMKHVLVLADGSAGEVGSRLAAQTASASAMARIRSSVLPDMESTLYEAFGEAHQATRRVLLGTGLADKAGASLLVVVVGADGLVVGRVGGGRVYLLRGDRLDPMYSATSGEVVGVGANEPEIVVANTVLGIGDRLIVLNEAAARPLAADLERLGRGGEAQLAASRLADAARRRGQLDPVSVQVIDIAGDSPRIGPHPALMRLAREPADTFGLEGRRLGRRRRAEGSSGPTTERAEGSGLVIVLGLGGLLGALVAMLVHAPEGTGVRPEPGGAEVEVAELVEVEETNEPPPDTVEPEVEAAPQVAAELLEIFAPESPRAIARNVRGYVTRNFPTDGEAVFTKLEEAIAVVGAEPKIIEALLELMREPELRRTAKWVSDLLPRLYAKAGAAADP